MGAENPPADGRERAMGLWEELASALAGAVTDDEVLTVIADVAALNISVLTDDELTLQL